MHGEVFRLLEATETARINAVLQGRKFVDGKATASGLAREVKHNLQAARDDGKQTEPDKILITAAARHADFQAFAMPSRFVVPTFSRYEAGMHYGPHVDNSLMGGFCGVRADLSMTLFLSDPASYDGGELVIRASGGEQEIKLDAGEAFVYSTTAVHYVAPITRGVRLAAVVWFQSAVRDERLRAILYDLSRAARSVDERKNPDLSLLLTASYHNLVRYAAEPSH